MNKKLMALFLTVAMLLSVLAGCGIGTVEPDQGGNSNVDVTPSDPGKAQLTVATWDGGIGSKWLEDAAALFEEMYKDATHFEEGKTGVEINVVASRSFDGSAMAFTPLTHDVYFVEAVDYYAMLNNEQLADLTDIMTTPLTDYNDNSTILEKLDPALQAALKTNEGKYYAIPFYETFYSFAYDLDLFDAKSFYISADGGWAKADGDLAAGPDGVSGTSDDGLPATYEEFDKLLSRMRDAGVIPFVLADNAEDYVANLMYEYWANYEGLEQMLLNYTFEGTATDLITVDENGNITELGDTAITFENGYELQRQAGRYHVLNFVKDVLLSTSENYKKLDTHINAQKSFVKGGITNDQPVAMIVEGSWWENEAKSNFTELEDGGYDRHNYAVMPMPHATADKIGQTPTWLAMSNSYGFVASSCDNVPLAKEFLKYLHTDERLSAFTGETNMTRALNYELLPEDEAKISTYAQSILELKETCDVIYPYSSVPQVLNNGILFNNFGWAWLSNVDGMEYKNPWLYFRDVEDASTATYFNGQETYFETRWAAIV